MRQVIRVVSIMEAVFVTGPAKNLLEFERCARNGDGENPPVHLSVVTYEYPRGGPNTFVAAARAAGIPVDLVKVSGRFDLSALGQLKNIMEDRKPDIIQTHNVKSHFLVRLSGIWRRHRWLAFQHGYTTTDFKMRCYNQLDRWSLRAPDRTLAVCGAFAADLERKGIRRERITVRHNSVRPFPPVDVEMVKAVKSSLGARAGASILLAVGRLSREKGHADLLRALDFMRRELHEDRFHLVIVGEGPERARIESLRSELGLDGRVTLAGLQEDVRSYYACADVVVLASHSEGSPNALLEAMAAGVPLVATRAGGIPEIVTDGETALLVDIGAAGPMARAIQTLIADPDLRQELARKAWQVAEERYSPDAYRESMLSLYEQVLNSPRKLRQAGG